MMQAKIISLNAIMKRTHALRYTQYNTLYASDMVLYDHMLIFCARFHSKMADPFHKTTAEPKTALIALRENMARRGSNTPNGGASNTEGSGTMCQASQNLVRSILKQ